MKKRKVCLSGRGSGFLAGSFMGAWTEAKQQAGRVYVEARRRGMSVEEAQQATFNVRMQNMALLLAMDPIQNLLAFGPGALLQKTMKKTSGFDCGGKNYRKTSGFNEAHGWVSLDFPRPSRA